MNDRLQRASSSVLVAIFGMNYSKGELTNLEAIREFAGTKERNISTNEFFFVNEGYGSKNHWNEAS